MLIFTGILFISCADSKKEKNKDSAENCIPITSFVIGGCPDNQKRVPKDFYNNNGVKYIQLCCKS